MLSEYPLQVRFKGEVAVELGGVTREMFSAFFSKVYLKGFDEILGTIISYLVAGFLPERLHCLAAALLGPESSFDSDLVEHEFDSCLSAHEAGVLRDAKALLIHQTILGSYGCRSSPNPQNIKVQAARYVKPAAAISQLNKGVPECHLPFWNSMTGFIICINVCQCRFSRY